MKKKNQSKRKTFLPIKKTLICILIIYLIYLYQNPFSLSKVESLFNNYKVQDTSTSLDSNQIISSENTNNQEDTITKLQTLSQQDNRINIILDNIDNYPEELLDMLSRNLEMLDFVLDFPQKKGQVFSDTIGNIQKGTIPLLLQYDPRWGYANYGENYLAISGCAPTALAMVITGLTGKNSITPYTVSRYAEENGYYTNGIGTSWSLMTEGSKHFGIKGTELPLSKSSIINSLKKGYPIICSMRPGDFTTQGHFIVLTGIKNGKITINDPNSKERSSQLWEYDTLEPQIKNLWSFQLI